MCQSYVSRFQFPFHVSQSTRAAAAPDWLAGCGHTLMHLFAFAERKSLTGMVTGPTNWDRSEIVLARRPNSEHCILLRDVGEDLLFDLWSVI